MNEQFTNDNEEITQLLEGTAETTNPNPHFAAKLERSLMQTHKEKENSGWFHFTSRQVFSTLAWTASLAALVFFMNWAISTVAPAPKSVPAANDTSAPPTVEKPTISNETQGTPVPNSSGYDLRGTGLYLNAPLPDAPSDMGIYQLKADQKATLESARVLAERFGLSGEVYISGGLYPAEESYFFTDGKRSLTVSSEFYFTYVADMAKVVNNFKDPISSNAETTINDFLQTHGFTFPHTVQKASLYTGYEVVPLLLEGIPMRYEFYSSRPMRVMLDDSGQILQVEANLMDYEPIGSQTYGIISAQEAFNKLLDYSTTGGKIESASSPITGTTEWMREYPLNEAINLYGYAYSVRALDPSQPAFVQIDGFTLMGNINGMDSLERNTFVEATGQFIVQNGITRFNVASWQPSPFMQDGIVGTLQNENGQVVFNTEQGEQLTIQPDLPADLPMPFENAFVVGTRKGDNYEWTLIDDRMMTSTGGGGGGGSGEGFYKLNLSGTPVPFPPAAPTPSEGDGSYIVQEGDTLTSIANANGITVDELMQANNITSPGLIQIDQQLIIPGGAPVQSDIGQKIESLRGLINITIYNQPNGSQRVEYFLSYTPENAPYPSTIILEGDNLQELHAYQNRPVEIWGTVDHYDEQYAIPVVKVNLFKIPFPDLQFQILSGTQKVIDINGQPAVLFTTEDGTSYLQSLPGEDVTYSLLGAQGDLVLLEAISVPDEIVGGYPTLRVFSSAMATSPKNEQPVDLTVTADQIYTNDETVDTSQPYTPPTIIIEKVELMYYVTNPHWQVDHLDGSPLYLQPAWYFYGHYDTGGEFEVIVQALKQEYLLPELDPYIPGG